jgi:beta-glucosidase
MQAPSDGVRSQIGPYFDGQVVGPLAGSTYTAMGWEVYSEGLLDLLLRLQQEYNPPAILVTENGAAYDDVWDGGDHVVDAQRREYLREHLQALAVALLLDVPVEGYFAWSLLDNFEWAEGYSRRFGIVYVDYPTQRRVIKESGRWYAELLAAHRDQTRQPEQAAAVRSNDGVFH